MTTHFPTQVECFVCKLKTNHIVIGSTNMMGPSDLDTRPSQMARSTLKYRIQRCTNCGYCFGDISEGDPKFKEIVESEVYINQLFNKQFPELANSFLCSAILYRQLGNFISAAWDSIYAAWACDDILNEKRAIYCRTQALKDINISEATGKMFYNGDEIGLAIKIDLCRRALQFTEGLMLIEENQHKITDDLIRKILTFEKELIYKNDTSCYTIGAVIDN